MPVTKLRIKKGFSYTSISNKIIQNLNNYEALGLYTYLISLPEDWIFYKKQLSEHANIGRDKIDKLLKILIAHNLVEYAQMRTKSGRFSILDIHVKDGIDFKINNLEKCAPLTEKPLTENQLLVNTHYKENNNKENNNTKKISKSYCASDDARPTSDTQFFEEFWKIYPRKKDKARAKEIWKRKKLDKSATLIMEDVKTRILNEVQWKDEKYIPHPSTYLRNERWMDELTLEKSNQPKEHHVTKSIRELKEKSPEFRDFLIRN